MAQVHSWIWHASFGVKCRKQSLGEIQGQPEKLAVILESVRPQDWVRMKGVVTRTTGFVPGDWQCANGEKMCAQQTANAAYHCLKDLDLAIDIEAPPP
jgi:hypothetical protein